jgi:membrane protein YdbS with pleckstrin-like domain
MTISPEPPAEAAQAPPAARAFHRLAPEQVTVARIAGRIAVAAAAAIAAAGLATLALVDAPDRLAFAGLALGAAVLCALLWIVAERWPALEYRSSGWALDEHAIHVRQGVWWRSVTSIPRARIQHTDVEQGPLQRNYDLATLVVHSAGTTRSRIPIAGLRHADALRIRDELLAGRDHVE